VARLVLGLALFFVLAAAPRSARACGVSGPGGVEACSLEEHDDAARPKLRVGASALYTATSIDFGGGLRAAETRSAVLASVSYFPSTKVSLQAGLGATLGGHLVANGVGYDLADGPTAALGASWRVLDAEDARPFVVLTALLSFEATTTPGSIGYEALDLRLGGVAGWTLARVVSPFVAARVFGGPVYWRYGGSRATGTDASHYQLGGGVALAIAKRVDAFVEGIPLGEQAVSGGIGVSF
jgi:hypothetical protein